MLYQDQKLDTKVSKGKWLFRPLLTTSSTTDMVILTYRIVSSSSTNHVAGAVTPGDYEDPLLEELLEQSEGGLVGNSQVCFKKKIKFIFIFFLQHSL